MSLQAMVSVTLSVSAMRLLSNTHSARVWPAFQNDTCSIGLFTVELT